jgi:hypothetical protein
MSEPRIPYDLNVVTEYTPQENAKNYGGSKELTYAWTLTCPGTDYEGEPCIQEPIVFRAWMGRSRSASMVYGALWVHPPRGCKAEGTSGRGTAGGWGYHKVSAVLDECFASAGIKVSRFGGSGEGAMRQAMYSLAAHGLTLTPYS